MNTNLNKMKKITLLFAMAVAFMSCAAQNLENLKTALPPNSVAITGVNTVGGISLQALATQLLPFLNLQANTPGATGKSAYDIWISLGNVGTTTDFINSLKGVPGIGNTGADGLSSYQIWLNAGNTGTQAQFLASLVGVSGKDGSLGLPTLGIGQAWVNVNGVITAVDANFLIPITNYGNQTASLTVPPVTLVRGGNYEVSAATTIASGSGSVTVQYTYTDGITSNLKTVTPTANTLTVINAKSGSVINFSTTVAGTVNYSFSPFIYTR